MLESGEQIENFEDWILYAPNAAGVIFTLYNVITGGSPIYKGFRGWDIRRLPPGYRAEPAGTTPYEEGLRGGCTSWGNDYNRQFSCSLSSN
jgi:hypothetical protein